MRNIKEALQLNDSVELEKEIEVRKALYHTLVGSLYPSIVAEEVRQLQFKLQRYNEETYRLNNASL